MSIFYLYWNQNVFKFCRFNFFLFNQCNMHRRQCDHMAILFVHCWAIWSKDNFPNSINIWQNRLTNPPLQAHRLWKFFQSGEISPNLVTVYIFLSSGMRTLLRALNATEWSFLLKETAQLLHKISRADVGLLVLTPCPGYTDAWFFKIWANPASFVYFRSFLIPITISIIQIEKSVDGVLGIRTWGRTMVGEDETTELWRHPHPDACLTISSILYGHA